MRVTVIGCGYLGATHAVGMAELGFEVVGVELDVDRLRALREGTAPFYEPGLQQRLKAHVKTGRLRFTDSVEEAASWGDVHFLCVGTPQLPASMGADLTQLESAVASLAPHLDRPALVVGKSTVPVGTAKRLAEILRSTSPAGDVIDLAWNPEFLREGHAIEDTLRPDRLVFGVTDERAANTLRSVYAEVLSRGTPLIVTDLATAELVKVSANAFLATKISFINAISEVCEVTGANVVDVADALGHDKRIGRQFLDAGIGFGGGCLPKDIRAFLHRAGELGVEDVMSFLRDVDAINQRRRERVLSLTTELLGSSVANKQVAVLGAAFKPKSDDVRDSPALWVAGQLHLSGARVRVYDPRAMENARARFPRLCYAASALDACTDADVVLHLTEWEEFRRLDPGELGKIVSNPVMIDGRSVFERRDWEASGWTLISLGRG